MGAKKWIGMLVFLLFLGLAGAGGYYIGSQNFDVDTDLGTELALAPAVDVGSLQEQLQRVKDDLLRTRTELDRAERERTRLAEQLDGMSAEQPAEEAPRRRPERQAEGQENPWGGGGMDMQARMEEMRQNDPERYQQIQDRIEEARTAYQDMRTRQYASLDERIQRARSPEEADVYESIKTRLQTIDTLGTQMMDPNAEVDRREAFQQIMTAQNELRELGQMDRDYQLLNLAQRMGTQRPEEAEALVSRIQQIYEDADSYSNFRGMMGGGMGGPMGGGGRGGRGR